MFWKNFLIVLFIAVFPFGSVVNAAAIYGYVEDKSNGEPLPIASVLIKGTERGTSTNLDGYFAIDYIAPGSYTLVVKLLGYEDHETTAYAYEDYSEPLHIEIVPTSYKLEEVEVTAIRNQSSQDRLAPVVSKIGVDGELVKLMPSLGGEMDVMRALQTIPGVKASSDLSSALYVRGGSPDQTLILMDHNVVYNPNHLFGIFSAFNADAVKHINLMKGAFPASYGGRSGSVLEVITDEGNRKKTEGLVSIGMISARAAIQGPVPDVLPSGHKGSYAFSFRRTYMDPMLDLMRNSYDVDLPDYYFYDANGKVNVDLSTRTTLTMAGYWGKDKLDMDFGDSDTRNRLGLSWENRTLSARLRHALGAKVFWSQSASVSTYQSQWSMKNDKVLLVEARDELMDYSLKSDIEMHGIENHSIKIGYWISYYTAMLKEYDENLVYVDIDKSTTNYSVYAQDSWRVTGQLEVLPGLRVFYHEAGQHVTVDPRLSVVYHAKHNLRFKIGGGKYSQFINVMTMGDMLSNFDIWFPIDGTLEPTINDQIVASIEYDAPFGLDFTMEGYYTKMHNVTAMDPLVNEGENASDAFIQGDGVSYGAEWLLRRNSGRWNGWIGYSLAWTKRTYPGTLINDGNEYYPKWDRRHDISIVSSYKLSRFWEMSASWRYNTGQGFTQALGLFTQRLGGIEPDYSRGGGRQIVNGSMNNYRFPDDHRLDVSFIYHHLFFGKKANLNISIYNAYNRRPYYMRFFDVDENPIEITDIKLLPILPLVSYEVRF